MAHGSSLDYTPYATQKSGGGGGTAMGVHATPDDAGAQVGAAIERAGDTGFEQAQKYQGFINETQMNNAETGFIKDSGDLKAHYAQYEGLQAEAMRPQYETQLAQLHSQYREGLPPVTQRAFDSTTLHQMAYQTSAYSEYAAGQVKQANIKSQDAVADTSVAGAGDLGKVLDDKQFAWQRDSIIASGNALADIHGDSILATGKDDGKGNYSYPNTPEGKAAQARHMQYTNTKLSQLYLTAAKTVADNQGASRAADWAKAHWDNMPDAAKVQMNQFLAPKMKNETISGNVADMVSEAQHGYNQQTLSNIPSSPTEITIPQKTALDTIRENEGYTGKVGKDSNSYNVLNGINEKSFPKEFAEAKNLLDTKGKDAADAYADNFYQKNIIDKYGISSLPASTQAIVADGLVNHGGGDFGQSLIAAAKSGAKPQELINMRRTEYQRLNDTGLPQYTSSFRGWNNRLDELQKSIPTTEQQQTQNAFPSAPNFADYLRNNTEELINNKVNSYLQRYPDDYYGAQLQEKRARTELNHQVAMEDGKLKADRDAISNAVGGALTKGNPVSTYEELSALPGMQTVLDRVHSQQGQFATGIDTMIAKASHRDLSENSVNGYDTITRALKPMDDKDGIHSTDHLAKGLGETNPAIAISWKDFNDAKPAIGMDSSIKEPLLKGMQDIATANGNLDGKGQQRAIQWYNQTMAAWKQNQALGDKGMSASDFATSIGEKDGPPAPSPPSRLQQLNNWAKSFTLGKEAVPTLTDKSQFDALKSGDVYIRNGVQYRKP